MTLFIFSMESPCILKRVISGLIELKKDSGMLLAPAILKDSAPIAGKMLDGTLPDLCCIPAIEL